VNCVKMISRTAIVWAWCFLIIAAGSLPSEASVANVKLYKAVFPGSKPTCIMCHIDKLPKKDEGMHELNAYGMKIKETKGTDEEITEETLKKVGTAEEFEAENAEAEGGQAEEAEAEDKNTE
jgi:hypothetical protein